MWGFSIPINLYTLLFVVMAPMVLFTLLSQAPILALILGAVVVAVAARRRVVRRRREIAEAHAMEQHARYVAELHAEAVERRLRGWQH